jgi:hypothetical protein
LGFRVTLLAVKLNRRFVVCANLKVNGINTFFQKNPFKFTEKSQADSGSSILSGNIYRENVADSDFAMSFDFSDDEADDLVDCFSG